MHAPSRLTKLLTDKPPKPQFGLRLIGPGITAATQKHVNELLMSLNDSYTFFCMHVALLSTLAHLRQDLSRPADIFFFTDRLAMKMWSAPLGRLPDIY